ncbi:TraR/DksA family transcriptional regulator [Pedosphaera parvula]|uniref:Transcriptional regulator, TraR/DksA family n=1 Tax=Pedosphaera parvula (strain Ellin514) TaxID=320771 RepID=B9XD69_PEDPL|nr:TraR/DksA C4-type zinc finger protein [Pedosphaera parvula]EEF62015.1 transcriptional regulator, TraR/DksA family [Pedosphaera parvula Ellin514]
MQKKKTHTSKQGRRVTNRPQAATGDILNPKARLEATINPKWKRHYAHLTELREHFLNKKDNLSKDANEETPSYSEHMADAGTDTYDRDFALSMLSADQSAVYEIEQAIQRIESNTYGICEMTGKPIQSERLNAIPWTRFSVEAERELERNGAANRAHLGALGSIREAGVREDETEDTEKEDEQS